MHRTNSFARIGRTALLSMTLALIAGACNDDDGVVGPGSTRTFRQVERLGNPLVSEVFFPKRDHGLHNTKGPSDDNATMANGGTDVPGHIASFVSQFPGRTSRTIETLQAVLSPDMLVVFPNRSSANPAVVGWLTWALAPGVGYGGRKLTDDVVDLGLVAVFGNALDPAQAPLAGLTSDNVGPGVRTFSATFPYLGAPR